MTGEVATDSVYSCPRSECVFHQHGLQQELMQLMGVRGHNVDILLTSFASDGYSSLVATCSAFLNRAFHTKTVHVELMMEGSAHVPQSHNVDFYTKRNVDVLVSFRPLIRADAVKYLPMSYIHTDLHAFFRFSSEDNHGPSFFQREPMMAAFISHCNAASGRDAVLARLQQTFRNVYLVGKCFAGAAQAVNHPAPTVSRPTRPEFMTMCETRPPSTRFPSQGNTPERARWYLQKECVLNHVMFLFAVENSFDADYVTEKLWQPLLMGAIPVYSVGNVAHNRKLLPHPDAALVVEDYASIDALGQYMLQVATNSSLWFKHAVAWRLLPESELSSEFRAAVNNSMLTLPCRLCDWWAARHR